MRAVLLLLCLFAASSVEAAAPFWGITGKTTEDKAIARALSTQLAAPTDTQTQTPSGNATDVEHDMNAAVSAYQEGDFEQALVLSTRAAAAFEAGPAFAVGARWDHYGTALLVRALALRKNGDDAQADAALGQLLIAMPDAVPDPALCPPKTSARLAELKATAEANGTATLSVRSKPSRARVYVDGRTRGVTPVVITDLLPGEHVVVVDAGNERSQRRLLLAPGEHTLNEALTPVQADAAPKDALLQALARGATAATLATRADAIGSDGMAAVVLSDGDARFVVFLKRAAGRSVLVSAPLQPQAPYLDDDTRTAAQAALDAGESGPVAGAPSPEALLWPSEEAAAPFPWLVVGLVAAGGVAAVAALGVGLGAWLTRNTVEVALDASRL